MGVVVEIEAINVRREGGREVIMEGKKEVC